MKKKILLTMAIVAAIAVAGCGGEEEQETQAVETQAQVVQTQAPVATEEPLAPILANDTQAADAGTGAFPTGVPLNQDAYTEFSEPVMYEVIEDCITWSGNDVQTSGGDLVQGSIVNAVAEDGNYLILDDQRVVEASHLQLFE
ncbi:MAG: hypothetical protein IK142_05815 [Clostridiales bacterium]|nr:hypothetical protein [Clostridiales bacterium]